MSASLPTFLLLIAFLTAGVGSAYGATLWDFVIFAEFDRDEIDLYESPVIRGKVMDHAMKPVNGTEVTIRFASSTVTTTTNSTGDFEHMFEAQQMPGIFTANIQVTSGDLKGLTKATIRVGEDVTTFNEFYYSTASIPEEANNPYKALQLKHYQEYLKMQDARLQKQLEIESKKQDLSEKRQMAEQKLLDAIEYEKPGYGTFSGYRYEQYMKGLNPEIKDVISSQLNYTKNVFAEARHAMKEVLDNGGSLEEARKVYFEKLETPKHEIEQFVANATGTNVSEIKKDDPKINSKKVKGLTVSGKK